MGNTDSRTAEEIKQATVRRLWQALRGDELPYSLETVQQIVIKYPQIAFEQHDG